MAHYSPRRAIRNGALLTAALRLRSWGALMLAALGAFLLGFVLECAQPLTGRSFDLADMAANTAGVAVGLVAIQLTRRIAGRGAAGAR